MMHLNSRKNNIGGDQQFDCKECDHKAGSKPLLYYHIKKVHEGQIFSCPYCNHKSILSYHLKTHIKAVHEGLTFSCPDCETKFTQKGSLNKHIKSLHEGVTFECEHCKDKFLRKDKLLIHIRSVHEGVMFSCPHCDYKAARKYSIDTHKQSVHDRVTFPCPQCKYKTSRRSTLRTHIKEVHEHISYQCPHCKYKGTQANLRKHLKVIHKSLTQCPHCKYKTVWKDKLRKHIKLLHKGEEPQSNMADEDFISDDEECHQNPTNDINTNQSEQEYFEPDIKKEHLSAAETDFVISDDEEDKEINISDKFSTGHQYLCPISSCTYSHSVRDGDKQQERAHFDTSHSDMPNLDNLHFIRLL